MLKLKSLFIALATSALMLSGTAMADANPFQMLNGSQTLLVADGHGNKCGGEKKCGTEAKCGAEKKCGTEAKCGAEKKCGTEAKCGAEKKCGSAK
ncbi:hypothetical protein THMIRHAS_10180 [Thiosulfatimonas sediminis]|uniref:Low-complexity protein n=1 Tax=Thiosulfatimonas sediminis TaxID=2675054 RepID=A0A6F8PU48_9GAMM|nr:low-complexity protein [Thiosulfatimonas sediminis]BBP45645.1 hypothetical protein THMIRHAS_10180 [Thiosulfatimonas sediminis]